MCNYKENGFYLSRENASQNGSSAMENSRKLTSRMNKRQITGTICKVELLSCKINKANSQLNMLWSVKASFQKCKQRRMEE